MIGSEKKGLQFPVREFHKWSVKDQRDQIELLSWFQARIALLSIYEGKSLTEAIAIAFSYPPGD